MAAGPGSICAEEMGEIREPVAGLDMLSASECCAADLRRPSLVDWFMSNRVHSTGHTGEPVWRYGHPGLCDVLSGVAAREGPKHSSDQSREDFYE